MSDVATHCFTTKLDRLSRRLINHVGIVPAFLPDGSLNDSKSLLLEYQAQWDTGATSTSISERAVKTLGLIPFGTIQIYTPNGESDRLCYICNITLPNDITIPLTAVVESDIGYSGIDILVGMDIIGKGDLIVSNYCRKTVFTYRTPSSHSYDFTMNTYLPPEI